MYSYGLGMPQYGGYVPTSCKNHIVLNFFPLGRSNWLHIARNNFLRFRLFGPLFRRFRLSRVSSAINIEEIYRFISKILHFMPSGSVLGRFCVLCTKLMALASKIYRKSIENLSKIYRKSIEHLSNIYRRSIEHLGI